MLRVKITFFGKSETISRVVFGVFQNPDYVYLYDKNFNVDETFLKSDIFHMTIKADEYQFDDGGK